MTEIIVILFALVFGSLLVVSAIAEWDDRRRKQRTGNGGNDGQD